MALDTYAIIHYDSSAHATEYADLITAGAVLVGAGIVDSGAAYNTEGILDGGTRYASGIFNEGNRYAYGILWNNSSTPTYAPNGIIDQVYAWNQYGILYDAALSANHAGEGIYDGTNYFTEGAFNATTSTVYDIEALDVLGGGML